MSDVKMPEPVAWISTVQCIGAKDYGKDRYGKLPIQSLQQGYYSHTPLITTEQAQEYAQAVRDEALASTLHAESRKDTERLEFMLRHTQGDALRYAVGELADTADIDEFRAAIDAAIRALKEQS